METIINAIHARTAADKLAADYAEEWLEIVYGNLGLKRPSKMEE